MSGARGAKKALEESLTACENTSAAKPALRTLLDSSEPPASGARRASAESPASGEPPAGGPGAPAGEGSSLVKNASFRFRAKIRRTEGVRNCGELRENARPPDRAGPVPEPMTDIFALGARRAKSPRAQKENQGKPRVS